VIAVIDVFAWHQERGGRVFVLLRRVYRRAPGRPQEPRREFRLRLAARLRLIRCHLGIGWHATADVEDAMVFGIAKAAPPLNHPVIVVALVVPILLLLVGRGAWVKSALSQVRRGIGRPSASILYRSTPSRDRSQRARVGTTDSFGGGVSDSQDQRHHTDSLSITHCRRPEPLKQDPGVLRLGCPMKSRMAEVEDFVAGQKAAATANAQFCTGLSAGVSSNRSRRRASRLPSVATVTATGGESFACSRTLLLSYLNRFLEVLGAGLRRALFPVGRTLLVDRVRKYDLA
jgi:hypothetical protein